MKETLPRVEKTWISEPINLLEEDIELPLNSQQIHFLRWRPKKISDLRIVPEETLCAHIRGPIEFDALQQALEYSFKEYGLCWAGRIVLRGDQAIQSFSKSLSLQWKLYQVDSSLPPAKVRTIDIDQDPAHIHIFRYTSDHFIVRIMFDHMFSDGGAFLPFINSLKSNLNTILNVHPLVLPSPDVGFLNAVKYETELGKSKMYQQLYQKDKLSFEQVVMEIPFRRYEPENEEVFNQKLEIPLALVKQNAESNDQSMACFLLGHFSRSIKHLLKVEKLALTLPYANRSQEYLKSPGCFFKDIIINDFSLMKETLEQTFKRLRHSLDSAKQPLAPSNMVPFEEVMLSKCSIDSLPAEIVFNCIMADFSAKEVTLAPKEGPIAITFERKEPRMEGEDLYFFSFIRKDHLVFKFAAKNSFLNEAEFNQLVTNFYQAVSAAS